jgi:Tfp pilus assembly protein PilV
MTTNTKRKYKNKRFISHIPDQYGFLGFIESDIFIKGQSLFEVVIAVGLSALILIAAVTLSSGSVRNASFSSNNAQATKYAQEAMEWLRGQRDAGWESFRDDHSSSSGVESCLNTSPPTTWASPPCSVIAGTVFTRSVTLKTIDPDKINALVLVTWKDSQGTHEVKTQTHFTDWR